MGYLLERMILELWNFAGAGGDGDGAGPRAYRRLHAVGEVLGRRVAGLTNHRTVISTDRRRHQRQRAGLQQADLSRFARRKQLRRTVRSTGLLANSTVVSHVRTWRHRSVFLSC